MTRSSSSLALSLLLLGACLDRPQTTAPFTGRQSAYAISHAPTGGTSGFYFLPPLVPDPGPFTGTFDGSRSLTARVVCTGASGPSCPVVASFDGAGSGAAAFKVDVGGQSYVASWSAPSMLSLGSGLYRLEVYDGSVRLGFADLWVVAKQQDTKTIPSTHVGLVRGSSFVIKVRVETAIVPPLDPPAPPAIPSCRSCLEVVPGTMLLARVGAQQQIATFLVDATGNRTPVSATFESSAPNVVAVSATGVATAVAALGSSQIMAHAGALTSAPVLALVAQPVAGALLVTDAQVVGDIVPVDLTAPYRPGWQYRVRLRNVTPQVGQVVLGTGFAAVGGRVVSVIPAGAGVVDVVLATLPLNGMLTSISVNQKMPLAKVPLLSSASAIRSSLELPPMASASTDFTVGPFTCEVKGGVELGFPLTVNAFTYSLNPSLSFDLVIPNVGLQGLKIGFEGTLEPQMTAKPVVTGSIKGEASCKIELGAIPIPIGGLLYYVVGGQIPVGIGFSVNSDTKLGGLGFDASFQSTVNVTAGLECPVECTPYATLSHSASGTFKPIIPSVPSNDREKLAVSVFGYADLSIGPPILAALQLRPVGIKAGLKQTLDMTGTLAQALDAGYASDFALKPFFEAKTRSALQDIAAFLSLNVVDLKYEPELPDIAHSPRATFTIKPANPEAGDDESLGTTTTFRIDLDAVTYLGFDAVDGVDIRWLKKDDAGNPVLEPGRAGCTSMNSSSPGQMTFECTTDFRQQDVGEQTFYAFVRARLFGVPIPVPLEIALDGKAAVNVRRYGHVQRVVNFTDGRIQDITVDASGALSGGAGGFAGTGTVTYYSTNVVTNNLCTFDIVGNGTGTQFTVTPEAGARPWLLSVTVSGNFVSTPRCPDLATSTTPFTLNLGVYTGVSILEEGVLLGIDFTLNTVTATATVTAKGALRAP